MAVTQPVSSNKTGRQFEGELYVAGVEGSEWLMQHRVWLLYLIGRNGNYRFYLTDRHLTGQGVPKMGQHVQVTTKWAKFVSQKLCFINAYEVLHR
jgi:hypothetical protein